MSWKMSCPKCGSLNLDLERDRRVAGIRGPHQVQLHCYTCGFVLYGEKSVQEECDKQYAIWLADRQLDPNPAPVRSAPAEESRAAQPPAAEADGDASEAEAGDESDDDDTGSDESERPVVLTGDQHQCSWPGCKKIARPRSKYCSRNCSNKNARSRHAARKT